MELLPQHMQAEILPTGTPPTNQYPIYFMGCFSHTSSSHRDLSQQTYAQYILYWMFLLHIQAEIMPTRIFFRKPVPSTFSKGCFSCMFRLKWCLRETPTQSCPLCSLFFLHSQAEIMPTGNYSYKPMLIMLYRMFLLHIQAKTVPTGNSSYKLKCSTL